MKKLLKEDERYLKELDSDLDNLLLEADELVADKSFFDADLKKSLFYYSLFGVPLLLLDGLMLYFWLSIYFLCGN